MSGTSSVGQASVYEAGDQRNAPKAEENVVERFEEGKENSHKALDSKDERSIANKLAAETQKDEDDGKTLEDRQRDIDPTLPARSHGNEPSKGAKIDKMIEDEEAEILKKKGAYNPQ
ncbi:Hypothetical protein R9X50_00743600 [Acrodontium crateriforme]|uniref:Uncharacterized protein n=1 Tax=Acrodontium crateriforme TaxID=150365 RepID=A0AAQ3RAR8_9PEZI|nr:Hypothetical protein R9X50_00743600 [Acrodontium crateriforme]